MNFFETCNVSFHNRDVDKLTGMMNQYSKIDKLDTIVQLKLRFVAQNLLSLFVGFHNEQGINWILGLLLEKKILITVDLLNYIPEFSSVVKNYKEFVTKNQELGILDKKIYFKKHEGVDNNFIHFHGNSLCSIFEASYWNRLRGNHYFPQGQKKICTMGYEWRAETYTYNLSDFKSIELSHNCLIITSFSAGILGLADLLKNITDSIETKGVYVFNPILDENAIQIVLEASKYAPTYFILSNTDPLYDKQTLSIPKEKVILAESSLGHFYPSIGEVGKFIP